MHMKIFHIAIVAMLLFAGHADAQVRSRHAKVHDADTVPVIVRSYVDSLQVGRTRVDSLFALRRDSLSAPDGRYYRLFVPFTFYHALPPTPSALATPYPSSTAVCSMSICIDPTSWSARRASSTV